MSRLALAAALLAAQSITLGSLAVAQFGVPADIGAAVTAATVASTTWNPADKDANIALSGGNLVAGLSVNGSWRSVRTIASESTGKWYSEFTLVSSNVLGVVGPCDSSATLVNFIGTDAHGYGYAPGPFSGAGVVFNNNVQVTTYTEATSGDVIGFAVDFGAKLAWWRVNNGVWNASLMANPATGIGGLSISAGPSTPLFMCASLFLTQDTVTANFGGSDFAFVAPAGFVGFH